MVEAQTTLIEPYGGSLVDLIVDHSEKDSLRQLAADIDSIILSDRAICDLEMIATGGFSPLSGFMNKEDYTSVLENMHLKNGTLFPIPITLPVDRLLQPGQKVSLRDSFANLLAIMTIEDIYEWDPAEYAVRVLGADDESHMLVREMRSWGRYNIAGKLQVLSLPEHRDFTSLRLTPYQVRQRLSALGNKNIVAFQTRNPLHRAHEELTKRAASKINGYIITSSRSRHD